MLQNKKLAINQLFSCYNTINSLNIEGDEKMPRQPNPNRPYWSAAIAEARVRAGLTQEELGKKINNPLTTIKKYETGARVPPFDVLYEIAVTTGVDVYTLMDLDERQGGSTGFSDFVEPTFSTIESYINDDKIGFHNLSDSGYTDNYVEIIDGKSLKSKIYKKTDLVLEVAKIKEDLKKQYDAELKKRVTEHVKKLLKKK